MTPTPGVGLTNQSGACVPCALPALCWLPFQIAAGNGISSHQIVAFLERNVHPMLATQTPAIPETVSNQMHLWASELNRIEVAAAKVYVPPPHSQTWSCAWRQARDTRTVSLAAASATFLAIHSHRLHATPMNWQVR